MRTRGHTTHLESSDGFTLIELLIVMVILGILLTIAVPSYLGFKSRASKVAAQADIRAAVPSIEAYFSDNNTYAGMNVTKLLTYDAGLKVTVISAAATTYCIVNTVGSFSYYKKGPAGAITTAACT